MNKKKYTDPKWLREQYHENEMTIREIAAETTVSPSTIRRHMEKHSINRRHKNSTDHQYDAEELKRLYYDEMYSTVDLAEHYDVSQRTIGRWMDNENLPRRPSSREQTHAAFYTTKRGYEEWATKAPDGRHVVRVHRIIAVAEQGIDAIAGKVVHHKNHIPWDNRPENIELLTPEEHGRYHSLERWRKEKGGA